MRNPLLSKLLGESDVLPVLANVPRETFRNRMVKARQIEDEGEGQDEDDSVKRMVKEAVEQPDERDEEIIPDDAEPVDPTEMVVGKPLREPKEVVQEPSHPTGEKEKYQTPYAALTAPDVTPMATQPIDPAEVPGAEGPEKFTASDLERAEPVEEQPDVARKAMDILLGRNRAGKPPTQPGEFEQAGAIQTEEQAAAALGIQTPLTEEAKTRAAAAVVAARDGGAGMPPPTPQSDGSAIYSAFRRFTG